MSSGDQMPVLIKLLVRVEKPARHLRQQHHSSGDYVVARHDDGHKHASRPSTCCTLHAFEFINQFPQQGSRVNNRWSRCTLTHWQVLQLAFVQ